jgi:hypothetical protein
VAISTAIGLLTVCSNPSGTNIPNGPSWAFDHSESSGTWHTSGDSLYLITLPTNRITHRCILGVLTIDSSATRPDTLAGIYDLSGQTLKLILADNSYGTAGIRMYLMMSSSNNAGLAGTWQSPVFGYDVIAGTLSPAEKNDLDAQIAEMNTFFAERDVSITLASGNALTTEATSLVSWADQQIRQLADSTQGPWLGGYDTFNYAVTITKLSGAAFRLFGEADSQTVTVSLDMSGNVMFVSSDTALDPHTWYKDPSSCPNPQEPAWFVAFFNANPKVRILDLPVRQPLARRSGTVPAPEQIEKRVTAFFPR